MEHQKNLIMALMNKMHPQMQPSQMMNPGIAGIMNQHMINQGASYPMSVMMPQSMGMGLPQLGTNIR